MVEGKIWRNPDVSNLWFVDGSLVLQYTQSLARLILRKVFHVSGCPWILSERRKTHSYNQRSRHETQPTCLGKCTRVIPCSTATSSPRFLSILCVSLVWLMPSWLMSQQSWNAVPCVKCFKQLTMRTHTTFPSADMLFFDWWSIIARCIGICRTVPTTRPGCEYFGPIPNSSNDKPVSQINMPNAQ